MLVLCKPSLSASDFDVMNWRACLSKRREQRQQDAAHSSSQHSVSCREGPYVFRPSRCFHPVRQASCCTAASSRALLALVRERRWGSARSWLAYRFLFSDTETKCFSVVLLVCQDGLKYLSIILSWWILLVPPR